jgi:hypothetical protein
MKIMSVMSAFRRHPAELRHMTPQRIHDLRPLAHEQVARPKQKRVRLLRLCTIDS